MVPGSAHTPGRGTHLEGATLEPGFVKQSLGRDSCHHLGAREGQRGRKPSQDMGSAGEQRLSLQQVQHPECPLELRRPAFCNAGHGQCQSYAMGEPPLLCLVFTPESLLPPTGHVQAPERVVLAAGSQPGVQPPSHLSGQMLEQAAPGPHPALSLSCQDRTAV